MAMTLHLDGTAIRSEADFHDAIRHASGIDFYGRNLDALWDLLTGLVDPPIEICWTDSGSSRAAMGARFDAILGVMRDAQAELGPQKFELKVDE